MIVNNNNNNKIVNILMVTIELNIYLEIQAIDKVSWDTNGDKLRSNLYGYVCLGLGSVEMWEAFGHVTAISLLPLLTFFENYFP